MTGELPSEGGVARKRSLFQRSLDRLGGGRRKRAAPHEQGAALVEFALSLTILLTLVFGILGWSFGLYFYNALNEAAREATRYAAVRGNDWGTACASYSSYDCTATEANIVSYIENFGPPGINADTLGAKGVSVAWAKGPNESACNATDCNGMGDQVTVTVSYTFDFPIPFIPPKSASLSSSSSMIVSY